MHHSLQFYFLYLSLGPFSKRFRKNFLREKPFEELQDLYFEPIAGSVEVDGQKPDND